MVARWNDDRVRHGSRRRRGPRRTSDFRTGRSRSITWMAATSSSFPGRRGSTSIRCGRRTSKSIAFVSDRTGVAEHLPLRSRAEAALPAHQRRRRRDLRDGVQSRDHVGARDRPMAFTYLENGEYTVWTIDNPRLLKRQPFNPQATPTLAQRVDSAAAARAARVDSAAPDSLSYSYYRSGTTFRPSSALADSGPQMRAEGQRRRDARQRRAASAGHDAVQASTSTTSASRRTSSPARLSATRATTSAMACSAEPPSR